MHELINGYVRFCKVAALETAGALPVVISNVSMFHYYIVVVFEFYNITLHKCFKIMIGVHSRSMFIFCSLEGLNNKKQCGSGF